MGNAISEMLTVNVELRNGSEKRHQDTMKKDRADQQGEQRPTRDIAGTEAEAERSQ